LIFFVRLIALSPIFSLSTYLYAEADIDEILFFDSFSTAFNTLSDYFRIERITPPFSLTYAISRHCH